ncbi:MAG: hypothetical protein GY701_28730 [Sulfitobacter sp.]|nr:hypothetical protein [Sulfitobacter sp.]
MLKMALGDVRPKDAVKDAVRVALERCLLEQSVLTVAHALATRLERRSARDDFWTYRRRLSVGVALLHLTIDMTDGCFEIAGDPEQKDHLRRRHLFVATDQGRTWLEGEAAKHARRHDSWAPTKDVPRKWLPGDRGLVRKFPDYLAPDMPEVLEALNCLMATEWRINERVAAVFEECWHKGSQFGGLPPPECPPLSGSRTMQSNQEFRWKSARRRMAVELALMKSLPNPLYFKWRLDFRGRSYPAGKFITPQSHDRARGLLEFAKGEPIGVDGGDRLALHGANMWGMDKASEEDRLAWVKKHGDDIEMVEIDPFTSTWWNDAADPWRFLAFCFEWAGYRREGGAFETHLPCQIDGTTNGYQIMALLTRDEELAQLTNLVPGDKPVDLYQEIADLVTARCTPDTPWGTPWLELFGGAVPRGAVKPTLIALAFGSHGIAVNRATRDWYMSEFQMPLGDDMVASCRWLSGEIRKALHQVVPRFRECVQWFKRVGGRVRWTTPTGMGVENVYWVQTNFRVRQKYVAHEDTDLVATARCRRTILPNFIHSLDAACMMKAVNRCDFDMVTIHDCFGALAPNMDQVHRAVREAYVEVFEVDRLADFAEQVGIDIQKHPLPRMGTFNPRELLDSRYCFT